MIEIGEGITIGSGIIIGTDQGAIPVYIITENDLFIVTENDDYIIEEQFV